MCAMYNIHSINDLYIKHTKQDQMVQMFLKSHAVARHKIFTVCAKGDLRRGHVANWEEPVTMND